MVIPFGGAWLEAMIATGQRAWTLESLTSYSQPWTLGPTTASGLAVTGSLVHSSGGSTMYVGVISLDR